MTVKGQSMCNVIVFDSCSALQTTKTTGAMHHNWYAQNIKRLVYRLKMRENILGSGMDPGPNAHTRKRNS
jgi:hypothetical protein